MEITLKLISEINSAIKPMACACFDLAAGTVPLLCLRWQSRYEELLHLRGRRDVPEWLKAGPRVFRV